MNAETERRSAPKRMASQAVNLPAKVDRRNASPLTDDIPSGRSLWDQLAKVGNGGFDDGLDGWRPSEHASLASPEHGPCLKLAGTGQDDSKAGCEVKLDEPMTGSVRLTFRGKRLGREPAGLVGITGRFDFTDGTWEWFNEPWRLLPAEAGRWVRKQGIYIAEKPVKSIGVWCINYRSGESTLIDDAYLAVFAERKERP